MRRANSDSAGLLGVGTAVVLFQRSSLDFPDGALGQAGQEDNLLRHLMSRDLLFGKFNQFCLGSRYPFLPGDIRDHDQNRTADTMIFSGMI